MTKEERREYKAEYRLANKEKIKKSDAKYRLANKEKVKKWTVDNYLANKLANKEKIKSGREKLSYWYIKKLLGKTKATTEGIELKRNSVSLLRQYLELNRAHKMLNQKIKDYDKSGEPITKH